MITEDIKHMGSLPDLMEELQKSVGCGHGPPEGEGWYTAQELAERLGVSISGVYKRMQEWENQGRVESVRRRSPQSNLIIKYYRMVSKSDP